jgi:Lamin Tail Domain
MVDFQVMISALVLCGWLFPAAAHAPSLLIWEFLPDPSQVDDASGEWIEFHNPTAQSVSLDGWSFSTGTSAAVAFDSGLVVPASGYVTIARTDSIKNGGVHPSQTIASGWSLPNSSGSLRLFAPGSTPTDSVIWGSGWPLRSGHSLERFSTSCSGNDASCWGASATAFGLGDWGTPGRINSLDTARTDTEGTMVSLDSTASALTARVWNRGLLDWRSRSVRWELPAGSREALLSCRSGDTCSVALDISALRFADRTRLRFRLPPDIRPIDDTMGIWLFQTSGAIRISEIQASSVQGQPEWIELSQGVASPFDLTGWSLGDTTSRYEFVAGSQLPPSGYLVVSANCAQLKAAWKLPSMPCAQLKTWPRLSQTEDLLMLRDAEGHVRDQIHWSSLFWGSWPNGKSRERRSRDVTTQQPDNWMTSPDPLGATPGWGASIPAGWNPPGDARLEFSLGQKLFAPGDVVLPQSLEVNVRAPQGSNLTISVYDLDRHRIRILWQGTPPTSGTVSWDGRTESGRNASMGAYLVLLESRMPDGTTQARKDWAVLGRRL